MNLKRAIKEKNVRLLAYVLFEVKLTPKQEDIVRRIAYSVNKRLSISAMTRYGKTMCVAVAICLYILFNKNKRVALIAPQGEQAQVIRNYLGALVSDCPIMANLTDYEASGIERLKKEASKTRLTFKNGCEYRVFSAYGEAKRLMGFGADIVIKDEACLIEREAEAKIVRMLGDDPENAILIELYNPWSRDNAAYDHTLHPDFHVIHIGWRDALKEGRVTQEFVDERDPEKGGDLTPIEFKVLYESEFPDQAEDALFNLNHIKLAMETKFADITEDTPKVERIISVDVADKGLDETVILWGYKSGDRFKIIGSYHEAVSENMNIVGRIVNLIKSFIKDKEGYVHIDCIGVGIGVISRLKEIFSEQEIANITLRECHFGKAPSKVRDQKRYINEKAYQFFRLNEVLRENRIELQEVGKLKKELVGIRWEFNSSGRIKISDSDDSPDWACALVYFTWAGPSGKIFMLEDKDNVTGLY